MFRKQSFEIRRKNKSDFFDHSTTLIGVPKRAFQQLLTINININYRMKVFMLKLTNYGVID